MRSIKFPFIVAAVLLIKSALVLVLWNALIPQLFHGPVVNFGQALGLVVLAKLLVGFGGRHHGHHFGHGFHWRKKWLAMSPEEREKLRAEFKRSCGGFAVILAVGGLLGATGCTHPSPEKRAEWVVSAIKRKLDLNDEQKAKLDAVKQAFLDTRKAHEGDRKKHFEEVKQMILSDKLDANKVKALMQERHKAMEQGFDPVFSKVQEFHASLSPEQKKKAVELMDKFSSHWNGD